MRLGNRPFTCTAAILALLAIWNLATSKRLTQPSALRHHLEPWAQLTSAQPGATPPSVLFHVSFAEKQGVNARPDGPALLANLLEMLQVAQYCFQGILVTLDPHIKAAGAAERLGKSPMVDAFLATIEQAQAVLQSHCGGKTDISFRIIDYGAPSMAAVKHTLFGPNGCVFGDYANTGNYAFMFHSALNGGYDYLLHLDNDVVPKQTANQAQGSFVTAMQKALSSHPRNVGVTLPDCCVGNCEEVSAHQDQFTFVVDALMVDLHKLAEELLPCEGCCYDWEDGMDVVLWRQNLTMAFLPRYAVSACTTEA